MKHKSNALQDVYLIQTHFKLEKFDYYESLMKQVYKELELKHCMLEEMQSRIEALEKDAARYRWLRDECGIVEYKEAFGSIGSGMLPAGDVLDAAIDTAMQSAQKANRREIERKITEEDNKRLMYVDQNDDRFSL